jgi:hypothetical protein
MGKLIRTNFDRHETRRDRRYLSPRIVVRVAGVDHLISNWSLGGFQAANGLPLAPGAQIAGSMCIAGAPAAYPFAARAVRGDAQRQAVGFRFLEISPALSRALERAVVARMAGRS